MGFNLNKARDAAEKQKGKFIPLDLNEGEVQAIFERCLATKDTTEKSTATVYSLALGYSEEESSIPIEFDKQKLVNNEKSIEYLYGQLECVHSGKNATDKLSIDDFKKTYSGKTWYTTKAALLGLLYLGARKLIIPFSKELGDKTILSKFVKPTLSPKDPAFPAWWEQHKSEWEA